MNPTALVAAPAAVRAVSPRNRGSNHQTNSLRDEGVGAGAKVAGNPNEVPSMWRMLLALIVIGSSCGLAAQNNTLRARPPLKPAEAISVTDILFPNGCDEVGTTVLDVVLTETGKVQDVEVRRDIPCLTEVVVQGVKTWTFSPATFAGKAIASRIPVAFTFRPGFLSASPVPLPRFIPQTEAAIQTAFQPAEVMQAAFPQYPIRAVVPGTVMLEVTLSAKGEAEGIKVLRDFPPFNANAQAVVKEWRFMSATVDGNPVPSKIVLGFVFRQPIDYP